MFTECWLLTHDAWHMPLHMTAEVSGGAGRTGGEGCGAGVVPGHLGEPVQCARLDVIKNDEV